MCHAQSEPIEIQMWNKVNNLNQFEKDYIVISKALGIPVNHSESHDQKMEETPGIFVRHDQPTKISQSATETHPGGHDRAQV